MLSQNSRPYIDASVPVLREHGLAITTVFYRNLFDEYPDLTNLFNMSNQANGVQQQSLAAAVFAYAANIDNAAALSPVVSRIAHKHASLGIGAQHYPIVGRHLLGAIQQTLGDAATPPLLAAWSEAYGLLADTLTEEEKRLYDDRGIDPGHMVTMRVSEVRVESVDITSFTLQPVDGTAAPTFKPGQYVTIAIKLPTGQRQLRQYSLSDAPDGQTLRISVKRESANPDLPAGTISNWLHDYTTVGSLLEVSAPFGDFTPDTASAAPIVLISAGVGVTPMISVLNQIARTQPERTVIFAHAVRNAQHHSHRRDLAAARERMPNLKVSVFYEFPDAEDMPATDMQAGLMHPSRLPSWPVTEANVHMCGPLGFMQAQWQALLEAGVPVQRLHREVFGPDLLDHLI